MIAADVVVHIVEDQVAGPPSNPMDTGTAIEPSRRQGPDLMIGARGTMHRRVDGAPRLGSERRSAAAAADAAPPPTRHNQHA